MVLFSRVADTVRLGSRSDSFRGGRVGARIGGRCVVCVDLLFVACMLRRPFAGNRNDGEVTIT